MKYEQIKIKMEKIRSQILNAKTRIFIAIPLSLVTLSVIILGDGTKQKLFVLGLLEFLIFSAISIHGISQYLKYKKEIKKLKSELHIAVPEYEDRMSKMSEMKESISSCIEKNNIFIKENSIENEKVVFILTNSVLIYQRHKDNVKIFETSKDGTNSKDIDSDVVKEISSFIKSEIDKRKETETSKNFMSFVHEVEDSLKNSDTSTKINIMHKNNGVGNE